MALRKILVVSTTKSQPKELYSEATVLNQLKDSLTEFGDISKMRLVVKESKATLELGDAVLPEGDFTLYITPKQIKAGGIDIASALRSLQEKINNSFDEVINELEDGDYGEVENKSDGQYTGGYTGKQAATRISAEDQAMLNELSSLR